jgi:glycosyltransferase involved in cell wall biosynthesis
MKISVVVCTYNRDVYLIRCLENLKNQDFNKREFEIIIIDNNSTDNTKTICLNFIEQNPELNIIYFLEEKVGLSHARNTGISKSSGLIISFIDDDGFAKSNYLTELHFISSDILYKDYLAFGGKVTPVYNDGMQPYWLSKFIEGVVSKVDLGKTIMPFHKKYPAGCNMAFRKEVFEQYGNFHPDLHTRGDDKFVFDKLKKNKVKILYVPKIEVDHFIDDYRLEKKFIIKLSKIIGQSEAIRLKESSFKLLFKFFEYIFKLSAAFLIALYFLLKKHYSKAYYIILVRYNVMLGFFVKNKI